LGFWFEIKPSGNPADWQNLLRASNITIALDFAVACRRHLGNRMLFIHSALKKIEKISRI
jgi:hypothetical protein